MHRADRDQPRRRRLHGQKIALAGGLDRAALAHAQPLVERLSKRIAFDLRSADEPLVAVREVSDEQRGAAALAFLVQRGKEI